ncbi:MAG TPA: hypothetical protein VK850_01985, partial [Candidatus Binatia bacterium]|nr:hypothetical protein [Candidatus Binatia bacterium]
MDDPAREQRNNPPIAFKPREFVLGLIVAVAIVFAVAGSRWFVRARTTSSASTCQAHLKQLQAAKDGWALDNHKRAEDLP